MIQHQPVPDWEERIDYQLTVRPGARSTVSDLVLDQSQIEFNVSGDSGTVGCFNVTIPKSLMNCTELDDWTVWVNGTRLLSSDFSTPTENATATFVYFTWLVCFHFAGNYQRNKCGSRVLITNYSAIIHCNNASSNHNLQKRKWETVKTLDIGAPSVSIN
jgi:hypothetical protein